MQKKKLKSTAAKRSFFLLLLGIPMMYAADCARQNPVCCALVVLYVLVLLVNGIACLPMLVEMLREHRKK